jgi:hypothetical protein
MNELACKLFLIESLVLFVTISNHVASGFDFGFQVITHFYSSTLVSL